jgi:hypothetical protein
MPYQWLGATGRRPAVEVLLVPEGRRMPLSLPRDDGGFDQAMPRDGWVAVKIGEHVVSLRDGRWLEPVALGDSWAMAPAADAGLLIVKRQEARSPEPDPSRTCTATRSPRSRPASRWRSSPPSSR